jgi:hypothetical protein
MLNTNLVLVSLNITTANILVFDFLNVFKVEIIEAVALAIPSVRCHVNPK